MGSVHAEGLRGDCCPKRKWKESDGEHGGHDETQHSQHPTRLHAKYGLLETMLHDTGAAQEVVAVQR